MNVIKIGIDGSKIAKTVMNGATVLALTGVGVLGWKLVTVHKRMNNLEVLDAKLTNELEEYFHYADEQKKKVEIIKEIKKEMEP